jgi:hypothetical protein
LPDDRQIVADEQDRQSGLPFEVGKQRYDLLLDGYVERADGLIANQQPRLKHHRSCDTNPLALAAAELVWIASCQCRVEPDTCQRF